MGNELYLIIKQNRTEFGLDLSIIQLIVFDNKTDFLIHRDLTMGKLEMINVCHM